MPRDYELDPTTRLITAALRWELARAKIPDNPAEFFAASDKLAVAVRVYRRKAGRYRRG